MVNRKQKLFLRFWCTVASAAWTIGAVVTGFGNDPWGIVTLMLMGLILLAVWS